MSGIERDAKKDVMRWLDVAWSKEARLAWEKRKAVNEEEGKAVFGEGGPGLIWVSGGVEMEGKEERVIVRESWACVEEVAVGIVWKLHCLLFKERGENLFQGQNCFDPQHTWKSVWDLGAESLEEGLAWIEEGRLALTLVEGMAPYVGGWERWINDGKEMLMVGVVLSGNLVKS